MHILCPLCKKKKKKLALSNRSVLVRLFLNTHQIPHATFSLLSPFSRHSSFKRHLPRQMQARSLDLGDDYDVDEQPTSIGRIKPELYKQMTTENDKSGNSKGGKNCGKINFSLRFDYENEMLLVKILKAFDLPAKDLCGSSDPYVKIYLLPDRKQKFQTRVHRKTLNPTFDESFQFPVPYDELPVRKLHLSVFDFDRFSRHDMIGEVILDNLFEETDLSRETSIWKDIQYATSVREPCYSLFSWCVCQLVIVQILLVLSRCFMGRDAQ